MKIFIALALFIATASATLVSQPVLGLSSLRLQQVPVVSVRSQPINHVRTLNRVAYSSPVVTTRVVSPVVSHHVVSSPVVYSSPVVSQHVVAAPVVHHSSPLVTNVITPIAVAHRRLIHTPL